MRFRCIRALAVALLLAPAFAAAQAVPPGEEEELGRLLPPVPGTRICHRQVYSAEHLAAHPEQTVTAMTLHIAYYRHDPDEFHPEGQRNYYFIMSLRTRDRTEALTASGECGPHDGKVGCGVDCDGGGFSFSIAGPDVVRVDFGENGRLRMTEGCGGGYGAVDFEPGPADREFVLTKTADDQCPAYEDWWPDEN
jgi:hypothetical protein